MCSTNPANWVTFDEEPPFQSPQKSQIIPSESHRISNPNGLKLALSNALESSSLSSSTGSSTPLSSPIVDLYLSPGPPCNSPLSTPIKDYPGGLFTPKSGIHILYPIPETSPTAIPLASPVTSVSSGSPKLSSTPTSSINDNPSASLFYKSENLNEVNSSKYKSCNNSGHSEFHFQYFQNDCAFSSPFWNEGCSSNISDICITDGTQGKDKTYVKVSSPNEGETCINQKSLNQCSFSYVCEKLQYLATDTLDPVGDKSTQCTYSGDNTSSFVPHSLFRSQRKDGWPFMLRIPEKKNMMSSRQWGPIYLKIIPGGILQMYYERGIEKPFREFQLHPYCKLSDPKLENFSVSGKIHTVKIEHVSYVEKRKYHPKVEVVHEAEIEQMFKLGTLDYNNFTDFLVTVEEELLMLPVIFKHKKNYEEQEMVLEIVDNFWGKITKEGKLVENAVITQIYCLCFVNSNTECFLTLNDRELQKQEDSHLEKETCKKWIDILDYYFHKCVKVHLFEKSRIIKFTPLDSCKLELMRFKALYNGYLPFSVKTAVIVQGAYVELQAFLNVSPSTLHSMKYCENITVHFPVPAQWIKALWTMNLHRQKSLMAKMNRKACLGSVSETESEPVIQVTIGTAKYESAYRAVVWKIDRLPDKSSSPDQPHSLSCKLELGSDQEIPSDWHPFATVQFDIPDTCASGVEVTSMGIDSDIQPQKHIVYKTSYQCQIEIEKKWIRIDGEDPEKAGACVTQ
ncbi:stonin-1 isoform X1 [Microcaecilia unicolor]|uniref:Stonin-1-like isoform X1 n=1 Tax=Microcaecilia unicolor TaxID=1415580 RepID=A0A6P7X7Z4_9AMPH|nr:stonin-1-like isoform X1 [Microcaecilia unicolor]XP_030051692.1 stonin-1-like isoform X1 [Microcaecilia unicolor]XP_030051693.1 stonin-1-like isoform X1 [Microcaecilia unicolor]